MTDQQQLPTLLFLAEQTRKLDQIAIRDFRIPGIRLMRRAGEAAFDLLRQLWPQTQSISVWCGSGNNGGDGYIIAGLAVRSGMAVQLVQVGAAEKLHGDARLAHDWALQQGVSCEPFCPKTAINGDVIVDAMLGTGLTGEVGGVYGKAIDVITEAGRRVLAVDIPSGLSSDTGAVLGKSVTANATISFIGLKQGLLTGSGPARCGVLYYNDLQVPKKVFEEVQESARRVDAVVLQELLPRRKQDAHKGDFGRVLVVGGNLGTGGAALMASQAACRVGAGLVSLATRPEHLAGALARCPEVMAHGIESGQDLEPLLDGADVIVIGPGLGQNAWSEQLLRVVISSDKKLVIDADALNLIASGQAPESNHENWIVTPHPGEAARLLGCTTAEIQTDRFAAVRQLQRCCGGVAILKGSGSLICGGGHSELAICSDGNPGMASGGMGDVLSGVLAGILAQGFELFEAAELSVSLHAAAADRASQSGQRGLLATDLLPHLRNLANPH